MREHVGSLEERKQALQAQLIKATEEKNRLIDAAQRTAKRLNLAERLVNGLKEENERWGAQVEVLKERKALLVGDIMIAASFVAYIGPFNEVHRQQLVHAQWIPDIQGRDIPMTSTDDGEYAGPVLTLAAPAQIAAWRSEGLPSDRLSLENGAIITSCARWPLLIDPQQQGVRWLRRHEEEAGIAVTQFTHRDWLEKLRRAMEDGTAVLIENVPEELDAALEPVLARATLRKGRKTAIRLGEREVEVLVAPAPGGAAARGGGAASTDVPLFKLYLQTKLPNPHFAPEVCAHTTLVNFSATVTGLQEQLLAVVVNRERVELEDARAQLVVTQNEFALSLKELEDDLLFRLANAEGDILADEELIDSLEATKLTVRDVELKAAEAKLTAAEINRARETFRPVATRASLIFFLMSSLSAISPMYRYSLTAFSAVFEKALDSAGKRRPAVPSGAAATAAAEEQPDKAATRADGERAFDDGAADAAHAHADAARNGARGGAGGGGGGGEQRRGGALRLAALLDSVTYATFVYVTRGLFERHRLVFAAKLALDVLRSTGEITADDVELLVRPGKLLDRTNVLSSWLPDSTWASVVALAEAKPSVFASLPQDMEGSWKRWKEWCDGEAPELEPLPQEWKRLSSYNRLVLVRALRPDRMHMATRLWVNESLGVRYGEPLPFDLELALADSSPSTPIFFLLSPGADPVRSVVKLAESARLDDGLLVVVSLGQGQEAVAEKALDRMLAEGGWVVLQNIELAAGWLPMLERRLDSLAEGTHSRFRVFLTAMPDGTVPAALLHNALKLTNEPPSGLKANMLRALHMFADQYDDWDAHARAPELKAVIFALCFFHSVVCERRAFGPIGWNRRYPFSLSDLSVCATVAGSYLESAHARSGSNVVPWEDLRHLFGEIIYGGHISDEWDRRLCATYLAIYLRDEMLDGANLAPPRFDAPQASLSHRALVEYVEDRLDVETPVAFGLHANSEVLVQTARTAELFDAIAELLPRAASAGSAMTVQEKAKRDLDDVLERLPPSFRTDEIEVRRAHALARAARDRAARAPARAQRRKGSLVAKAPRQLGRKGA